MANSFYGSGGAAMGTGNIDWSADTIRIQFVDANYAVDLIAHNNYSDITLAGRIGSPEALVSPTFAEGVLTSSDVVFTAIGGGGSPPTITGYVLYKDTGVESTSTLIAHYDTAIGFPLLTNGGDITIQPDVLGLINF